MPPTEPDMLKATAADNVLMVEVVAPQLNALRSVDRFAAQLEELSGERTEKIWVLDFAGVTFIVTQAIGALMVVHKRLRSQGGRLVIVGLTDSIRRVFQLIKLDQVFTLAATREEALAAGEAPDSRA